MGELLVAALGTPLPDILYDGVADPRKQVDGKLPDALAIRIRNNGKAVFANFDAPALKASAAASGTGAADKDKKPPTPKIVRDLKAYDGELPPLEPVSIKGLK
jgi:hypothetical protein